MKQCDVFVLEDNAAMNFSASNCPQHKQYYKRGEEQVEKLRLLVDICRISVTQSNIHADLDCVCDQTEAVTVSQSSKWQPVVSIKLFVH